MVQFGDPEAERAIFDCLSALSPGQTMFRMTLVNTAAKQMTQPQSLLARRRLVMEALSHMKRRKLVLSVHSIYVKLGAVGVGFSPS